MCGYCTESIAIEVAQAEEEGRIHELASDDHSFIREQFVQEASDLDAALAHEGAHPLSALCRRLEAAAARGVPFPPLAGSGHPVVGDWRPPAVARAAPEAAEAAASLVERFVAWWTEDGTEGAREGRRDAFEAILPELWAAFAVARVSCPPGRVAGLARALATMRHPFTPHLEARELWLQRKAVLAWHDAEEAWSPPTEGGIRPELLRYLEIRRGVPRGAAVP